MKTRIALLTILMFLFVAPFVFAQEDEVSGVVEDETIVEVVEDETITAEDLNVSDPTLLPDSTFYFLKNWKRGLQSAFTFNKVKKAELRLRFANERLIEAEKLAEETGNEEILAKAIENYEKAIEKVEERANKLEKDNPDVERFLNKFVDNEIKRQKLVDGLAKKLPEQARERLLSVQEGSLERFANIITRLDDPDKLQERIDIIGEQQEGSKYKHFKNLEVLSRIEEKLPEQAKDAIHKAQENAIKRLHGDLANMSPEDQERFKDYLSNIGGNELRHAEIIDMLENEDLSEDLREKLKLSRERIVQRIGKRLDDFTNEEERDKYLRYLEKGDIGKLRVLNELEKELPEAHMERIRDARMRAEDKFGQRIENLDEEKKAVFFEKMDKVHDVRTFDILNNLEERLSPEGRGFIEEMRERALKGLELEYEGAQDEMARKRIIERLSGDDPKYIEMLRELQDKVDPNAREALREILERTELRNTERLDMIQRIPFESSPLPVKDVEGWRESTVCPAVYEPVCATNGKTYSNECKARVAGVRLVHKGVCKTGTVNGDATTGTADIVRPSTISPLPSLYNVDVVTKFKELCQLKRGTFIPEKTVCRLPDGTVIRP